MDPHRAVSPPIGDYLFQKPIDATKLRRKPPSMSTAGPRKQPTSPQQHPQHPLHPESPPVAPLTAQISAQTHLDRPTSPGDFSFANRSRSPLTDAPLQPLRFKTVATDRQPLHDPLLPPDSPEILHQPSASRPTQYIDNYVHSDHEIDHEDEPYHVLDAYGTFSDAGSPVPAVPETLEPTSPPLTFPDDLKEYKSREPLEGFDDDQSLESRELEIRAEARGIPGSPLPHGGSSSSSGGGGGGGGGFAPYPVGVSEFSHFSRSDDPSDGPLNPVFSGSSAASAGPPYPPLAADVPPIPPAHKSPIHSIDDEFSPQPTRTSTLMSDSAAEMSQTTSSTAETPAGGTAPYITRSSTSTSARTNNSQEYTLTISNPAKPGQGQKSSYVQLIRSTWGTAYSPISYSVWELPIGIRPFKASAALTRPRALKTRKSKASSSDLDVRVTADRMLASEVDDDDDYIVGGAARDSRRKLPGDIFEEEEEPEPEELLEAEDDLDDVQELDGGKLRLFVANPDTDSE